jgi:hypothetical protein
MSVNRIDQTPLRVSTQSTAARQTPKRDFGDRMKAGLETSRAVSRENPSGITPGAVADTFEQVLTGIADVENYLRAKGAVSQPGILKVMSEISLVKLQLARLVNNARNSR